MKCPLCNTDNPDSAQFCGKCGAKLSRACIHCGAELPAEPEIRFCYQCGAETPWLSVPRSVAPAAAGRLQRLVPKEYAQRLLATRGKVSKERRVVTMLFSDVEGSTALARTMDPEDWAEIMDGAFDFLIAPIYRYEGTLARLMGDAVLAFFGAPIAHEDDPERACRAALEIVAGAREYAQRLEDDRGLTGFDVRVGIHTGLVVVGEAGSDLRVEYTAMGGAVNLASRMESAAEPGTVLVSEKTHKLIDPLFETQSLGAVQVKGQEEPVPVFRVLGARDLPGKVRGIAGLASPLVGREAEFAALQKALQRLQAGVGGIVTLIGEAGLGKSRLVAELRKKALTSKVRWVEGRCLPYATSTAYQLWLEILRGLLGVTEGEGRNALQEQVVALCQECADDAYPYLARLVSPPVEADHVTALRDLDSETLQDATFGAVETLLGCTASDRPLAVVCEDLHWADPTSIELLERLLALTDRAPLLLICVFRPQREHGSWRIKETAARTYAHRYTELFLQPLSASESETLLSNLLRMPSLLRPFQEQVLTCAEGNPFYLEEILRSLIDSGAILHDEDSGSWRATQDLYEMRIPGTLQGVLMARVDRLPEDSRRVLQIASVIGRIFPYRLLATIAGQDLELDAHLLTLQREQMIRERARVPEHEYIFKHHLTEQAAYNGLLKKQRRLIHRQVAESMERLFPARVDEQVGLLAYHWQRGGRPEKATPYLLRAGDRARALYAHAEAEQAYRQAVGFLLKQGQEETAARTYMKLGLVYTAGFEPDKARQAYDEAFALWEPLRESTDLQAQRGPAAVLRLAAEEPLTLDPGLIGDDVSTFMAAQLFEGLVMVDPDHNVLPAVAARWETMEAGTRYVFHLQQGLCWSDGQPVTARDFEYAWKRNLDPRTQSPAASLLYVLGNARAFAEGRINDAEAIGVTALKDSTLEVRLEGPTAYLPHLMAHTITYPLPRWALEAHGEAWTEAGKLVSNGAYRLKEWVHGNRLVLNKNSLYRGPFPGNAERVACPILPDFAPRLEAYAADKVDAVSMITADPGTTERVRALYGRELMFIPRPSTFFLVFRSDVPPFDDLRVRRAFVHAVDRERMAKDAWQGRSLPGTGGFVPPGMPAHSPGIGLAYDPDLARRQLAEAGFPDGQGFPAITWSYSGGSADEPVVPFLRSAWREHLGLDLEPVSLPWGEFVQRLERTPANLTLLGWSADYPDPDDWLRAVFHSSEGANDPRWRHARFDALVEEAARVVDQAARMRLYREADWILVAEEAVIMPLSYGRGRILAKPWVELPQVPCVPMRLKNVVVRQSEK